MNIKSHFIALTLTMACAATGLAVITPEPSPRKVSSGTLERFVINSPEMGRDVEVEVLLPAGYDTSKRYPVVYMHDGQNLFDSASTWNGQSWEIDEAVERIEGQKPIVVGVHSVNETRYGDLMPTEVIEALQPAVVEAMIAGLKKPVVKGDKYVDFLAGTLKREIDSHYSTLPDAADTSVMGSSMGGLASFYAMCRHPETFGGAACLSTHFIGGSAPNEIFPTAFAAYLLERLPLDGHHRIYFDTGDQTIDAYYGPYFERIMKMLEETGMDERTLMHRTYPGDAHEEASWAQRVDIPLRFLLGK